MCSTHARPYLDSLAQRIWSSANPHLLQQSMDWSVHDLAMRLFVEAPQELLKTHQGYAVDMMDHFREYRGRYAVELKASAAAKERMRQSMVEHFRQHADGAKCQVEDFEGEGKFAIFIYHEDEVTPQDTFDDDGIVVPNWIRPVVRIAAVYYRDTCTLLVKAPRKPEREKLRDLFAEIFIGDRGFFEDLAKTPKFSFAPLADRASNSQHIRRMASSLFALPERQYRAPMTMYGVRSILAARPRGAGSAGRASRSRRSTRRPPRRRSAVCQRARPIGLRHFAGQRCGSGNVPASGSALPRDRRSCRPGRRGRHRR